MKSSWKFSFITSSASSFEIRRRFSKVFCNFASIILIFVAGAPLQELALGRTRAFSWRKDIYIFSNIVYISTLFLYFSYFPHTQKNLPRYVPTELAGMPARLFFSVRGRLTTKNPRHGSEGCLFSRRRRDGRVGISAVEVVPLITNGCKGKAKSLMICKYF